MARFERRFYVGRQHDALQLGLSFPQTSALAVVTRCFKQRRELSRATSYHGSDGTAFKDSRASS